MKSTQIRSFSGPYFPILGLNMGKYGPEKNPYLDTFHTEDWSTPCLWLGLFPLDIFEKKVFLMQYFSNWSDFSVCLSLLLEILGNMYIVITYFSVYKVINFEVHFQILHDHKFQDNNLNILIKKALKVK